MGPSPGFLLAGIKTRGSHRETSKSAVLTTRAVYTCGSSGVHGGSVCTGPGGVHLLMYREEAYSPGYTREAYSPGYTREARRLLNHCSGRLGGSSTTVLGG